MIPRTLSEWSIEAITALLEAGTHESEEFDFKKSLPDSRDEDAKRRLRAACCAFANSSGGFLVFGVDDDKNKPPSLRLAGISATVDFPSQFGDYPRRCHPSVHWIFKNPPLQLGSGSTVHVVHVPPSWKAPHAYGDADQGWRFTKRTNKGTENMAIEEIRGMFLGFYEKRIRLQLLDAELVALQESAEAGFVNRPETIEQNYSLVTFGTQTIDSLIVDTYPLTAGSGQLLAVLQQLRQAVVVANNKASIFFATANLALTEKNKMIRHHNEFMAKACARIMALAGEARTHLRPLLVA